MDYILNANFATHRQYAFLPTGLYTMRVWRGCPSARVEWRWFVPEKETIPSKASAEWGNSSLGKNKVVDSESSRENYQARAVPPSFLRRSWQLE